MFTVFVFFKNVYLAKNSYYLDYSDIQKDIMKYGPTEASFEVYDDFIHYKSGMYTEHCIFNQ